jgi:hypothetical protein
VSEQDSSAPPRRKRWHIDPSDLLLEVVSIVMAILLALGVNEWRDGLQRDARARAALAAIRSEVAGNRAQLVAVMPHHRSVEHAFRSLADAVDSHGPMTFRQFIHDFSSANPHGYMPFSGESTAWDLARTSTVLSDVDYRTRAALERAYAEQTFLGQIGNRVVEHVRVGPVPPGADFYPVAVSFALDANDVTYSEGRLLGRYDDALRALGPAR